MKVGAEEGCRGRDGRAGGNVTEARDGGGTGEDRRK